MTTNSTSVSVDAAVDVSRFQRNLLALLGEKANQERRASEMEERLSVVSTQAQDSSTRERRLEEERCSSEARAREALERVAALRQGQEDERARHALRNRLLESQAAASQKRIKEQEHTIKELEEQLRTRNSECSTLRAYQGSGEALIRTFRESLDEVGKLVEAVGESERVCKAASAAVTAEQEGLRERLEACRAVQLSQAPRVQLQRRLAAATAQAREAQQLSEQRLQAMQAMSERVARCREREELGESACRAAQQDVASLNTQLASREALLVQQRDRLNATLARNMRLSESTEQLSASLRREQAVVQLLLRELVTVDAGVHAANWRAQLDKTQPPRAKVLEGQIKELEKELVASKAVADSAVARVAAQDVEAAPPRVPPPALAASSAAHEAPHAAAAAAANGDPASRLQPAASAEEEEARVPDEPTACPRSPSSSSCCAPPVPAATSDELLAVQGGVEPMVDEPAAGSCGEQPACSHAGAHEAVAAVTAEQGLPCPANTLGNAHGEPKEASRPDPATQSTAGPVAALEKLAGPAATDADKLCAKCALLFSLSRQSHHASHGAFARVRQVRPSALRRAGCVRPLQCRLPQPLLPGAARRQNPSTLPKHLPEASTSLSEHLPPSTFPKRALP